MKRKDTDKMIEEEERRRRRESRGKKKAKYRNGGIIW